MKLIYLLSLITITSNIYSGVKIAIDTNIFKGLKYVDLNYYLSNKILIEHIEEFGQYLFKYDLTVDNLTITNITSPTEVIVNQLNTSENLPLVQIEIQNILLDIQMKFNVKFGIFSESAEHLKIHTNITSINGEFYFLPNGEVEISKFNVKLTDVQIDMESQWLNFLIGLFTNFITNKAEKYIESKNKNISETINNWVNNEFLYDLGFGIGFNLTNIDRPKLNRYSKVNIIKSNLYNLFYNKKRKFNENIETTILTCGIHGSIYPYLHPELKPKIPEAVNMTFKKEYYDNEVQILISDYTINTLLNLIHQSGYLHMEFKNELTNLIPWNYTVEGLKNILPEYSKLYPNKNYEVEMKCYISISNFPQPKVQSKISATKLTLLFGLDFDTFTSDDPFDDPVKDLKLNITSSLDIHFLVDKGNLTIVFGSFHISNVQTIIDNLKIDVNRFEKTIENAFIDYLLPALDTYVKNIPLVDYFGYLFGFQFKNLRVGTENGYIVGSLGVNGVDFT